MPIKHKAFAAEHEWRIIISAQVSPHRNLVKTRPTANGLVPYVELPIALDDELIDIEAVYVGPTQHPERGVASARMMLQTLGYDPDLLKRSEIPFRRQGQRPEPLSRRHSSPGCWKQPRVAAAQ